MIDKIFYSLLVELRFTMADADIMSGGHTATIVHVITAIKPGTTKLKILSLETCFY